MIRLNPCANAAQGAQMIAKRSAQTLRRRVQRKRATLALHGGRDAGDVAGIHLARAAQSRIAAEKQCTRSSVPSNQPVKNRVAVFAIEKNRSASQICGTKRANLDRFAIENRWGHARSARSKINRCVLLQQGENNLFAGRRVGGLQMELIEHDK